MGRRIIGLIVFASMFAAAGREGPAADMFTPNYVSGKITSKPNRDDPDSYLVTAKFVAAMFPPGYSIDRDTTPVSMQFGMGAAGDTSWGWAADDGNWKAKGSKHAFKTDYIKVKGDLATGLFKIAVKKIPYYAPGGLANPVRFNIFPTPDSFMASDVWTPDPRKENCFFYER